MSSMQTVVAAALLGLSSAGKISDAVANRPVSKVVTLLKDMSKQLEKEQAEDEEIYEKMACWCTTNDKAKTAAIAAAESRIKQLTNEIEELTALSAKLTSEIDTLKAEVAENEKALAKATSLREKELAEFNSEEKELLETISTLGTAIEVLSKHQGGASLLQVSSALKKVMTVHGAVVKRTLTRAEHKAALAFIQAPEDYFDAEPTFKQSYAPQSGQIFGILEQMKEEFEANLAQAQKDEAASQKAYEELKAAKEAEIAAGNAQIDTKTKELAATDEKNAQAKEDLEDTRNTLSADEEYLLNLKEKCSMTDKEWEERQKTRTLELEAVSKALEVLSGDDAQDMFARTFKPAFVQVAMEKQTDARNQATAFLKNAATNLHSPRLAALAVKVRLDAFTKVKKAIEDMITALLQEKADEIKHKDFCVDELDKNTLETEEKDRQKADLEALIADLELKISDLTKAIDQLKAEVGDLQVQLKRAGEDRESAAREFQMVVADQRNAQKMLQAALDILSEFYGKSFLQQPAGPPPPAGFKEYKKNAAAGGVMGMIQQIVDDAKAMEKEAIRAEEDATAAYATFVEETNLSIETKAKDIANKSEIKAKTEGDLVDANEDKDKVVEELGQLADYKSELHSSCDYVLKNFDVRQQARDEEIEALKQAKAILSGAKFSAFLQGKQ